jgi:hypothetical protein
MSFHLTAKFVWFDEESVLGAKLETNSRDENGNIIHRNAHI